MKKTILALGALCLLNCSQFVYAQSTLGAKNDEVLVLKLKQEAIPFHTEMKGMLDNDEQSIARGVKEGAALQFFLVGDGLEKAGVDKKALVRDVDDFVSIAAKYYKQHTEIKGMQIFTFSLFPGYNKPYQITKKSNNKDEQQFINQLNETLRKNSKCNAQHFCSATYAMEENFINPEDANQKINSIEFEKFLQDNSKNDIRVYTSNKDYLNPIVYFVIVGTNGYLATEEKIRAVMKNQKIR